MKNFKKIIAALLLLAIPLFPAFGQLYTCSNAMAQTYNTLDQVGLQEVLQNNYTFVVPPSSSIAVTTGVLTTSLDGVYTNAYFYYPSGAWTGWTGGWAFTSCSSTTTCLVYQNQYTSGVPATPLAPALVTTGAGAFTQATGSYINGRSLQIPGNIIGTNGQLSVTISQSQPNSAGQKFIGLAYGSSTIGGIAQTTNTGPTRTFLITNKSLTYQYVSAASNTAAISGFFTTDSTQPQYITERVYPATATDYIVSQSMNIQVQK